MKEETGSLKATYEQQQAQLQKKREELNNKLQELQELENQQIQLERHGTKTHLTDLSIHQTGDLKEQNGTFSEASQPLNNSPDIETNQVTSNQCSSVIDSDNYTDKRLNNEHANGVEQENDEEHSKDQQNNVWNYLLQQKDQQPMSQYTNNNGEHSTAPNNQSDDSESDNDHLDDQQEVDEDIEREQMLSFRAKLSTFENLSKCENSGQTKPKPARSNNNNNDRKSANAARSTASSGSAQITTDKIALKSRPPAAEDLAHSEEMRIYQQRLQRVAAGNYKDSQALLIQPHKSHQSHRQLQHHLPPNQVHSSQPQSQKSLASHFGKDTTSYSHTL